MRTRKEIESPKNPLTYKRFWEVVDRYAKETGERMTQEKLISLTGLSKTTINAIWTGARDISRNAANQLAETLHSSPDYLRGLSDAENISAEEQMLLNRQKKSLQTGLASYQYLKSLGIEFKPSQNHHDCTDVYIKGEKKGTISDANGSLFYATLDKMVYNLLDTILITASNTSDPK